MIRSSAFAAFLCLVLAAPKAGLATPLVDLFFVIDTSADMSSELASLQANAVDIMLVAVERFGADVAFGLAQYNDFPSLTYPNDTAYQLESDLNTNQTEFVVTMLSLSVGNGGDTPESNLHALHQAAVGGAHTPSWRAGAFRILIWIGNAPGHDGDLEPGYPSDVGLSDAINALVGEDIIVEAVSVASATEPGLDETGQATAITAATGGSLTTGASWNTVTTNVVLGAFSHAETVVPEPSTALLFTTGLAGLAVAGRRRSAH